MTKSNSIWRWTIDADLHSLFSRLVSAEDAEFSSIVAEYADQDAQDKGLADMMAEAEAHMRLRGLPQDVLDTMLKGMEAMRQAQTDWGDAAAQEVGLELALASSHGFSDGAFARIAPSERSAQVQALFGHYRTAIAQASGAPGKPLAEALDITEEKLLRAETCAHLHDLGFSAQSWVWQGPEAVHILNQIQEADDLPIDITLTRQTPSAFAALGAVLSEL